MYGSAPFLSAPRGSALAAFRLVALRVAASWGKEKKTAALLFKYIVLQHLLLLLAFSLAR
jgi:hypothetical protein